MAVKRRISQMPAEGNGWLAGSTTMKRRVFFPRALRFSADEEDDEATRVALGIEGVSLARSAVHQKVAGRYGRLVWACRPHYDVTTR